MRKSHLRESHKLLTNIDEGWIRFPYDKNSGSTDEKDKKYCCRLAVAPASWGEGPRIVLANLGGKSTKPVLKQAAVSGPNDRPMVVANNRNRGRVPGPFYLCSSVESAWDVSLTVKTRNHYMKLSMLMLCVTQHMHILYIYI